MMLDSIGPICVQLPNTAAKNWQGKSPTMPIRKTTAADRKRAPARRGTDTDRSAPGLFGKQDDRPTARSAHSRSPRMAHLESSESSSGSSVKETLFMPTVVEKKPALPIKKSINRLPRETAETMAAKQKDIAVSEFFAKNR